MFSSGPDFDAATVRKVAEFVGCKFNALWCEQNGKVVDPYYFVSFEGIFLDVIPCLDSKRLLVRFARYLLQTNDPHSWDEGPRDEAAADVLCAQRWELVAALVKVIDEERAISEMVEGQLACDYPEED